MKKNYYQILGVGPDEDEASIRSAYLQKAKLCHPDRAGLEGKTLFQDVAEAYDVLSHPEKKRRYDRDLKGEERESRSFRMRQDRPEPLNPKKASGLAPAFNPHCRRKSPFQELFETILSEYQAYRPGYFFEEAVDIRIVLSEIEVARGCMLKFGLDIPEDCSLCGGCGGTGHVSEYIRLRIRIPSGAEDGSAFEVPLASYGFDRVLRIRIQVRKPD